MRSVSDNPFAAFSQNDFASSVLVVLGSGMNVCFAENELQVIGEWGGRSGKGVAGHPGTLALWELNGGGVFLALGRRHLYEGYSPDETAALIDAAGRLGVRQVVLTNAAGGLNPLLQKGDLVLHSGYIGTLLGRSQVPHPIKWKRALCPEVAVHAFAAEEVEVIEAKRRSAIHGVAAEMGIRFREGVYAGVTGPSYETRAEIRMLRRMGADLVGMSTILEVRAAARYGMETVGFSLVTNRASDTVRTQLAHDEVTEASAVAALKVRRAVEACLLGIRPQGARE